MSCRIYLFCLVCLLALLAVISTQAQDKQLSDAKTLEDVIAYFDQEMIKVPQTFSRKEAFLRAADVLMSASEKLFEIAENDKEKRVAYRMKFLAFQNQKMADVEGAEQKLNTLLDEMTTSEHSYLRSLATLCRYELFYDRVMSERGTTANLVQAKSELKTWFNQSVVPASDVVTLGLQIAKLYRIPTKQLVEELVRFVESPDYVLNLEEKEKARFALEVALSLTVGHDPKLYGKTLEDKDFKWEDLRGKYVLVNFTATWCLPCQMEIPALLESYKKYHVKGFEIVSVYIGERGKLSEQVEVVRNAVEKKKLPWIILSEALTERAKQPKQSEFYYYPPTPTMVLVDKEGKVIASEIRTGNGTLQAKLKDIFK